MSELERPGMHRREFVSAWAAFAAAEIGLRGRMHAVQQQAPFVGIQMVNIANSLS